MDSLKACRLNELFEKAMLEQANGKECIELKILYTQFSDEDREKDLNTRPDREACQIVPICS